MGDHIPMVASPAGSYDDAPDGAIPVQIYGITSPEGGAVTSVNGRGGDVTITLSELGGVTADFVENEIQSAPHPVDSVNGKTDTVVLTAADVNAVPSMSTPNRLYGTDGSGNPTTYSSQPGAVKSYTGQVLVGYTGLSLTGFTANVNRDFPFSTAVATVAPSPTTVWPYGSATSYDPGFYDSGTDRLRENNVPGQQHEWRIIGNFSGKAGNNSGALVIELYNPDSLFSIAASTITLPEGVTSGNWSASPVVVADTLSLAAGRGYRLRARTTFNDNNFVCEIATVLRMSRAVENVTI